MEIRRELDAANAELAELLTEQGHQDEAVKAAVEEDHRERIKAARTGKRLRDAITSRRSKVQEVKDRAEELPYLLHSARLREAELRKEVAEAREPELEAEVERTLALLPEADRRLKEAEAENAAVHADRGRALAERQMNEEARREATFDLQRLQRVGPLVEIAVPQSPNAI
jgi:hypothetical protein